MPKRLWRTPQGGGSRGRPRLDRGWRRYYLRGRAFRAGQGSRIYDAMMFPPLRDLIRRMSAVPPARLATAVMLAAVALAILLDARPRHPNAPLPRAAALHQRPVLARAVPRKPVAAKRPAKTASARPPAPRRPPSRASRR